MKLAALLVALISFAAVASAETVLAAFEAKAAALGQAIAKSKLDDSVKDGLNDRLDGLLEKNKCEKKSPTSVVCQAMTDDKLEAAQDAVDRLNEKLTTLVAKDGDKSLTQIFAPKIDALNAQLAAAKIDPTDAKNLKTRIDDFSKSLTAPGFNATPIGKFNKNFDAIVTAVDDTITLAKNQTGTETDTAALAADYSAVNKLLENNPKLNAAFIADFEGQLAAIRQVTGCAKLATSCNAGPVKTLAAENSLKTLTAAIQSAMVSDDGKTLSELYAPQIAALNKEVSASKLDSANKQTFTTRLKDFTTNLPAMKVEAAAANFQTITNNINAALALDGNGQEKGTLSAAYLAQGAQVEAAIAKSELNVALKQTLNDKLSAIRKAASCDKLACPNPTAVALQTAQTALTALSAELAADVKEYGSENLTAIYAPQTAALTSELNGSAVDAADKTTLKKRITAFTKELAPGASALTKSPGSTSVDSQRAQNDFAALKKSVEDAISLTKQDAPKTGLPGTTKTGP